MRRRELKSGPYRDRVPRVREPKLGVLDKAEQLAAATPAIDAAPPTPAETPDDR